jgi:hypothetical protein
MPSKSLRALALCAWLACRLGCEPCLYAEQPRRLYSRPHLVAELGVSPLFSLSPPFRGGELSGLGGVEWKPFEADLRVGGAYDAAFGACNMRFDLCLGLGSGLRAIVGCLLLFDEPALPGTDGSARVAAKPQDWPNRFGLGTTLLDTPWRLLGARLALGAELIYTSYRLDAKTALSGAAAFAAGVEAKIELRLRWDP